MITIGLLGGIASGKSTVARLLAEHGAVVLDADVAAHEALDSVEVKQALAERWGEGVIGDDGQVDRSFLADKVFGDSARAVKNRSYLEQLVHPIVRTRLQSELASLRKSGTLAAVLDVPLLLEAGYQQECDLLLFVDTPEATRKALAVRRGWSADEFACRESAQRPITEKRGVATDVVKNDATLDSLQAAVTDFWRRRVAGPTV